MNWKHAAAMLCLVVSVGCSSTTEQIAPFPDQNVALSNPENCRIYVYRDDSSFGSARDLAVYDNWDRIGLLGSGHYLCWERPPGSCRIALFLDANASPSGELEGVKAFVAQAGKVYHGVVTFPLPDRRPLIKYVPSPEAQEIIKGLKPPPKAK